MMGVGARKTRVPWTCCRGARTENGNEIVIWTEEKPLHVQQLKNCHNDETQALGTPLTTS